MKENRVVKYSVFLLILVMNIRAFSAALQLTPNQPVIGPDDIANLIGAAEDRDNVGSATANGGDNDATTYISFDRPAQGQTFLTPSDFAEYQLNAVSVRHAGYSVANNAATWYRMSTNSIFTIRVTEPDSANTSVNVLHSETYTVTGSEDNIFSLDTASNTINGTGTWFTFTFDSPVIITPNTIYGFDIGSDNSFFETLGIKDTAANGNPYPAGSAYISGANGVAANTISSAPGDRVFILHLTGIAPTDGDLNNNGKVDLFDVSILAENNQSTDMLPTLSQIAANWLSIDPPLFDSDPITESNAIVDELYFATLSEHITYYDTTRLFVNKVSGPDWLSISTAGILTGTPSESDLGTNTFNLMLTNEKNDSFQVSLQIDVTQDPADFKFLETVPFTEVAFNDEFWKPRLETNRQVTVPYIFDQLEGVYDPSHDRVSNFAIAGGLETGTPRYDFPFDDTDIYKTLEGASYSLMVSPDPELEQYLDELIVKIAAAQDAEGDGYLYTVRTNGLAQDHWGGNARWLSLSGSHELYNAGHLFEAAIAHYQATGKTSLLNVATKFADLLVDTFHDGGVEIPPGHEIVESALARLYQITGNESYLTLARYFIDIRGTVTDDYSPWGTYNQDHLPVLQQQEAVGHVVRAIYLYMGMADVAACTHDYEYRDQLLSALDKIWHSVNDTKAYITGGLGASHGGESFGDPYDLPHDGYCETCAQIANVMWNQRMFLFHREGKYIDVLERTLYNSVTSGVSLDGDKFFYPNPLISTGGYTRSSWFSCNCCLGNIARMIPSVPGYVYCKDDDEIYVNLYIASTGSVSLAETDVSLTQVGSYPWQGDMAITVTPDTASDFTVKLRIPGWTQNQPLPSDLYSYKQQINDPVTIDVNGESIPVNINKGYVAINRTWQPDDVIHISLPMNIRQVKAHANIDACTDQVAIERGPIVYCVEWPDYVNNTVFHLVVPDQPQLNVQYQDNMLNDSSIVNKGNIITGTVKALYQSEQGDVVQQNEPFKAIPYYAWAHRGTGPMTVWLADTPDRATPIPQPTPNEMVAHYSLDETSGTIAYNLSGKEFNGTLADDFSFDSASVPGPVNNALSFDGTNQYIDLPDGLYDFSKGCTISLWVYPTAVQSWSRFIDFGNGSASDNIWFGRRSDSNDLAFECWSGGSNNGMVSAANAITLDEWQMFTVTVDSSGNARLFKNGQLIQTGNTMPTSVNRTNNYIGRSNWSGDAYYQGSMDDIIIYNYNISDSEVADLYSGQ